MSRTEKILRRRKMSEDIELEIEHDLRMKLKEIILAEDRAHKHTVIDIMRDIISTTKYEDLY